MATTTVTADREVAANSGTKTTWTAARDATTANSFTEYSTSTDKEDAIIELFFSGRGGGTYVIGRTFLFFDVSGVGGTITAIDLKIYGVTENTVDVMVAKSTAFGGSGDSAFVEGDFDNWYLDNPTAYMASSPAWSINTYNTLTLNSTAVSDANTNGYLNVVVLGNDYDYVDTEPLSDIDRQGGVRFKNGTYPIELAITYTPTGWDDDVNGVVNASIGKVAGIAEASIGSVNGT
tara:strand:+ start:1224 stop:1925 length:702 start_codon:yes stop_codon:yes gene_type:complete